MLKVSEHFIIYKNKRFYSAFPAVVTRSDGNVLCVFRRARDPRWLIRSEAVPDDIKAINFYVDHYDNRSQLTQVVISPDGQQVSEPEILPIDPEVSEQDASLLQLNDGRILLMSNAWYPIPSFFKDVVKHGKESRMGCFFIPWGKFVRFSVDEGKNWSSHEYITPRPGMVDALHADHCDLAVRGQAIEYENEIMLPMYGGNNRPKMACHLFGSKDGGKNWIYKQPFAYDAKHFLHLSEPSLHVCPSGKIVAFIRTNGGDDNLAISESTDGGYIWSYWREFNVQGLPFHPLRLPDNRVLLTYGYRAKPFSIRARILDPECNHIESADEFTIRDGALCGDIGYPWSTILQDGRVLISYYFTTEDGIRHIAGSIIEID